MLSFAAVQKFLVIQTAFIGDAVLATALIEKLHQLHGTAAEIDFLVRKGNEGLFTGHPYLKNLIVWDKKKHKYRNLFSILGKIRGRKYDYVINVQRYAATGLLTAFSGAKTTIGFDKNPWSFLFTRKIKHVTGSPGDYLHEVDRNQLLIAEITDATAARPRLYPSAADYEKVRQYQQANYACVAPASVWYTKQYPTEKWVSFIKRLPETLTVYLLGAPGDAERCEKIKSETGGRVLNLAGQLTFLQSAALQERAQMNYVNDSAPMHFASSVNAPVTAVYCSTVPSFGYGPLSNRSFIVQTEVKLDCKPCGIHGYKECPLGHFKCAYTIEDHQLLEVLNK